MDRNECIYKGWILRKVTDGLCVSHFDCGDYTMNMYFRRKSKQYRSQLLVESYHFCPVDYKLNEPVVLVDICNDAMRRENIPDLEKRVTEKKTYLETFPAVKIARLGRNHKFRDGGAGTLLLNALKSFFTKDNRTGCRFFTVDAYKKIKGFYTNCGFMETLEAVDVDSDSETIPLFFDLKTYDETKVS